MFVNIILSLWRWSVRPLCSLCLRNINMEKKLLILKLFWSFPSPQPVKIIYIYLLQDEAKLLYLQISIFCFRGVLKSRIFCNCLFLCSHVAETFRQFHPANKCLNQALTVQWCHGALLLFLKYITHLSRQVIRPSLYFEDWFDFRRVDHWLDR